MTKELHELSETAAWMSYLQITTSDAQVTTTDHTVLPAFHLQYSRVTCRLQRAIHG